MQELGAENFKDTKQNTISKYPCCSVKGKHFRFSYVHKIIMDKLHPPESSMVGVSAPLWAAQSWQVPLVTGNRQSILLNFGLNHMCAKSVPQGRRLTK